MEILRFTIAAGELKRFEKAGRYVEVIAADAALSMFFFDQNGGQVDDAQGIVSGLYMEEPFRAFQVYSATAQNIALLISDGRGGSRRQPGNVTVIDSVAQACQTKVFTDPGVVGLTSVQLVAPASNVNGLVVRAFHISATAGAGGNGTARVFATPGPATNSDTGTASGAQSALIASIFGAAGVPVQAQEFKAQRSIPAGWGLFLLINANVAAFPTGLVMSFELL